MSDILVTRSSMPTLEEYVEEIAPLWESRWLTNMGAKHQQFEEMLKERLDVQNVCLFTNGHNALECILEALELHGEVITTPFSFASTTHAITRKGLTPVFADIKEDNYTLDPACVEKLITPRTCAILPVHVYGNLCDTAAFEELAKKHGLKLIYDAAHAFDVKVDGVSAARFGDASMYSFHATKVFHTIEGGAVCFNDAELGVKLNQWKNFGITDAEHVEYVGGNAKMNEFCAAMGICNLRHLDEEIAKRKSVYERYMEQLSGVEGLRLSPPPANVSYNYAYLPVVFEDAFGAGRDEVYEALRVNGIRPRKYFYPLINDYDCYRGVYASERTPAAQQVAARVLTLPMYADLGLGDVDRICGIIKACKR